MAKGSGNTRKQYPHSKEHVLVVKHTVVYNESVAISACNRLQKIIDID
jgi:hypothetical protein